MAEAAEFGERRGVGGEREFTGGEERVNGAAKFLRAGGEGEFVRFGGCGCGCICGEPVGIGPGVGQRRALQCVEWRGGEHNLFAPGDGLGREKERAGIAFEPRARGEFEQFSDEAIDAAGVAVGAQRGEVGQAGKNNSAATVREKLQRLAVPEGLMQRISKRLAVEATKKRMEG